MDVLSSIGSAFNSKSSLDFGGGGGGGRIERSSSKADSAHTSNPIVMSFETITQQPNRSIAESVATKPHDTITQSTSNEQENRQPNNPSPQPQLKDQKINIIDH